MPPPVLFPAVLTRSGFGALGVELCVLVEGYHVVGVGVAKDMATVATMMSALEEVEGLLADRGVADDSIDVRFPVGTRGFARYFSHGLFSDRLFRDVLHMYSFILPVAC